MCSIGFIAETGHGPAYPEDCLAICKAIVEACSGKIEIDSALGHGTRVSVTLPALELDADVHTIFSNNV